MKKNGSRLRQGINIQLRLTAYDTSEALCAVCENLDDSIEVEDRKTFKIQVEIESYNATSKSLVFFLAEFERARFIQMLKHY